MKLSVHDISLKQFHIEHSRRIAQHYAHAREKHPYFCDMITSRSETDADTDLKMCRQLLVVEKSLGEIEAVNLIDCELCEAMQAYAHGDVAQAVEELYDMIAVCLRTIDVLEGRQELRKPEEVEK